MNCNICDQLGQETGYDLGGSVYVVVKVTTLDIFIRVNSEMLIIIN